MNHSRDRGRSCSANCLTTSPNGSGRKGRRPRRGAPSATAYKRPCARSGLMDCRFPTVGDAGALAPFRAILKDVGYTQERIAAALHVPDLPGAKECQRKLPLFLWRTRAQSRLDTLIRLFLLQQCVPRADACSAVTPTRLEDWESL